MANNGSEHTLKPSAFDKSRAAVEKRLPQLCAGRVHALGVDDLEVYKEREVESGWRLPVEVDGVIHYLDLLLSKEFPWQKVRIAIVPSRSLEWPHVEKDGVLCLGTENDVFNPEDPVGHAESALAVAKDLVSKASKGEIHDDFRNEIVSYWGYASNDTGNRIVSLIETGPPSREIFVCQHNGHFVIADSDSELRKWLSNLTSGDEKEFNVTKAVLIWLQSAPLPCEYPKTYKELLTLVRKSGSKNAKTLNDVFNEDIENFVVVFGMDSGGPCLVSAGFTIPDSVVEDRVNVAIDGFRKGKYPRGLMRKRLQKMSNVTLGVVRRADSSWIHGRDKDSRAKRLRQKKVAVVGCGSVGGAISVQLAQAGVGELTLIDPDYLDWPNVGRHVLGANAVGHPKVEALAVKLRSDLPHIMVHPHRMSVQSFLCGHSESLDKVDLVLSTSADWAADHRVDAWQQNAARPVPVVYGWIEAHACAGHAVLIDGPPDSIKSGIEASTGHSHFEITTWDNGDPLESEPGCGGQFQPYGQVELAAANSVIAGLALDALLGRSVSRTHIVWVAQERLLRDAKGRWSDDWQKDSSFRHEGGFVIEREWPRVEDRVVKAAA